MLLANTLCECSILKITQDTYVCRFIFKSMCASFIQGNSSQNTQYHNHITSYFTMHHSCTTQYHCYTTTQLYINKLFVHIIITYQFTITNPIDLRSYLLYKLTKRTLRLVGADVNVGGVLTSLLINVINIVDYMK